MGLDYSSWFFSHSSKQSNHRLNLLRLAKLAEVRMDARVRVDAEGVIDRRQDLRRVHRVLDP